MKTIIEEMVEDREDELKEQKALEIARKMRESGADVDYIVKMTNLTVDDVLKL